MSSARGGGGGGGVGQHQPTNPTPSAASSLMGNPMPSVSSTSTTSNGNNARLTVSHLINPAGTWKTTNGVRLAAKTVANSQIRKSITQICSFALWSFRSNRFPVCSSGERSSNLLDTRRFYIFSFCGNCLYPRSQIQWRSISIPSNLPTFRNCPTLLSECRRSRSCSWPWSCDISIISIYSTAAETLGRCASSLLYKSARGKSTNHRIHRSSFAALHQTSFRVLSTG